MKIDANKEFLKAVAEIGVVVIAVAMLATGQSSTEMFELVISAVLIIAGFEGLDSASQSLSL